MDGLNWRTASYSGSGGGNCVEVASAGRSVLLRDTKDTDNGPVLRITAADWARFTAAAKR